MTGRFARLIVWLPRILGIAVGLFLGMFALDAFSGGEPLASALSDFAIHLLPAATILAVVAIAWRFPWVGAIAFVGFAVAYAVAVRRLDWVAAISAPLLVVGLLFLASALAGSRRTSLRSHP
jgi:hypothetical protein